MTFKKEQLINDIFNKGKELYKENKDLNYTAFILSDELFELPIIPESIKLVERYLKKPDVRAVCVAGLFEIKKNLNDSVGAPAIGVYYFDKDECLFKYSEILTTVKEGQKTIEFREPEVLSTKENWTVEFKKPLLN